MSQETIGAKLRQAREAKKLSIEQVYAKTKIHVNILQALEEDRFQEQSLIYLKSFLKIYAQFLKLDVDVIMQEFKELYQPKTGETARREMPKGATGFSLPKFKIDPRLIKLAVIAIAVIALLFVFISFVRFVKAKLFNRQSKQEEVAQETIVKPKPLSEERKPKFAKLAIRTNENSWLQVRLDGKMIYEGTFKKNMSESWQAKDKIEFSVGNAGAIEAEINGQILTPLGKKGEVIKNIVITRDGFSLGKGR
jgi:cytoskeletal protein RodZ